MAQVEVNQPEAGTSRIVGGALVAFAAAAIFVVLTARTGTTYHLFPLLIAFLPAGLPRVLAERQLGSREATIAAVIGLLAMGGAWLALALLDEMPSATLIADQPGGVGGEFALFGIAGALLGGWWCSRPVMPPA
ncbi:MAG: hypothetical protein DWG79_00385 [Chloroflexi bacterium]|nr:hypothetical protein [Chloroflexota bacterium]MDA1146446.1 hypothetical protein [Chloroflexota bacterium]MQC82315.1 hypothetical protein [Chloroflexota bacterium]MQC82625.1 hypothetical protein [Chloroflexota bacterium]